MCFIRDKVQSLPSAKQNWNTELFSSKKNSSLQIYIGLQESILAAALARIGRRVLHFDR